MKELHTLLLKNCDIMLDNGYTKPLVQTCLEDIPNIVQTVTLHQVILRSLAELSQFRDGIEALGVGKALTQYSSILHDIFVNCNPPNNPLTASICHYS